MSFRIGKVEHAANISFGLEKSKSFYFLRSGIPALSPFGWFLLNPSKKKQTIQTLPSDLRSNIYNNQKEYQICFTYYYFSFVLFFQTDTTNTELKPVFGSSICKIESVFTEDNIVSSRCKRKQSYKALKNTCSYPTICPTLFIWKSSNSSPCMGRLYKWVWSKPTACIYTACPVLPTRMEQISPFVITNATRGNPV